MNGHMMNEMARLRIADMQRDAREAREAHAARAARKQRASASPAEEIAIPAIPDYPADMFKSAPGAFPARRAEEAGGRRAGTSR